MKLLLLIPNIGNNSFQAEEIMERQSQYIRAVHQNIKGKKVECLVLYSGAPSDLKRFGVSAECLSVKSTSIIVFALKSLVILMVKRFRPDSIVAGTPFQPLAIALFIKSFFLRAKIHTSIHGEISALSEKGVRNRIKLSFLRLFVSKSATVRFVSNLQMKQAMLQLNLKKSIAYVAPVPIFSQDLIASSHSTDVIAFIGRMQKERGVKEWIQIGQRFDQGHLLLIGQGPLSEVFRESLPNAHFLGSLSNAQVQETWSRIGVLLSTAPHESYGLTMREALLHGVPVVSRRNVGSIELHAEFPELISVYSSVDEAAAQIREFLSSKSSTTMESEFRRFRESFFEKQDKYLEKLALAWSNEL